MYGHPSIIVAMVRIFAPSEDAFLTWYCSQAVQRGLVLGCIEAAAWVPQGAADLQGAEGAPQPIQVKRAVEFQNETESGCGIGSFPVAVESHFETDGGAGEGC